MSDETSSRPDVWTTDRIFCQPELFHLAFSWDASAELSFLLDEIADRLGRTPRSCLVPGCGTGRYSKAFAERGLEVLGYDINEDMLAFARKNSAHERVKYIHGDMAGTVSFDATFDCAAVMTNTFCYLLEPDQAASHLRQVFGALNPGGILVLDLGMNAIPQHLGRASRWSLQHPDCEVQASWLLTEFRAPRAKHRAEITVYYPARKLRITTWDDQPQLIWEFPALYEMARACGFEVAEVFDQAQKVAEDPEMPGRYYVFMRRP